MLMPMEPFQSLRVIMPTQKCLIHVLMLLALLSSKNLVQSRAYNYTDSLQEEDGMATDEDASGEDTGLEERRSEVVPAEWATWDTNQKVKYYNEKASEQFVKVIDEDLPKFRERASEASKKTPGIKISERLDQLDGNVDGLRKTAQEIKEGKYNKGSQPNDNSGFKVTYVMEGGQPKVKIHKDLDGKVDSLVKRSTPMREQHAERSLKVATAFRENFGKIYNNWGVPGKELEVMADTSLMLSGVLAAIPSPYTKGLAVLLDFVSAILGVVAPSAEDKVKKYITDAVDLITNRLSMDHVVEVTADYEHVRTYWHFVMITRDNTQMTVAKWNNFRSSNVILDVTDKVEAFSKCQGWMQNNMDKGENPGTTREMLEKYWRMVELVEQVYTRIIHTMPTDTETGNDALHREYISRRKTLLENTVKWLTNHVVEFTRSSFGALHHLYPPARGVENREFFGFMSGITYESTSQGGKVFGVPDFQEPPKGSYYLETAAKKGYYVFLDKGSKEEVTMMRPNYFSIGGGMGVLFEKFDLGTTVTVKNTKETKIKIEEPHDAPYFGARSLTFEASGGRIKFMTEFRPPRKVQKMWGRSIGHTKESTAIFAEGNGMTKHRRDIGISVDRRFRVIPLKKEAGMPGTPVIIGDAMGNSFLSFDTSKERIFIKSLNDDETSGTGGDQKKRVAASHVFYLVK